MGKAVLKIILTFVIIVTIMAVAVMPFLEKNSAGYTVNIITIIINSLFLIFLIFLIRKKVKK